MSNVVPKPTLISSGHEFETQGDLQLVDTLLKKFPRYNIPERLRQKVIDSAERILDDRGPDGSTVAETNTACKLILEADKRNIDIVKMIMPHQIIHKHVSELSDEELRQKLQELVNEQGLVPSLSSIRGQIQESY